MSQTLHIELKIPDELPRFRLPDGVQARLQELLDRQDAGEPLSVAERSVAEGLVNLSELFSLILLKARTHDSAEPAK